MKKNYVAPEVKAIVLETEEILSASYNPIMDSTGNQSTENPATDFGSIGIPLW